MGQIEKTTLEYRIQKAKTLFREYTVGETTLNEQDALIRAIITVLTRGGEDTSRLKSSEFVNTSVSLNSEWIEKGPITISSEFVKDIIEHFEPYRSTGVDLIYLLDIRTKELYVTEKDLFFDKCHIVGLQP